LEKILRRVFTPVIPGQVKHHFHWDGYRMADACVALTPREAQVMRDSFRAPPERVHVVPNGVEDEFFQSGKVSRGPWLICTATVTERKRVVELAEAALLAQTPLWIVGKPYSDSDPYTRRFLQLVAQNPKMLRYEGPVNSRVEIAKIYRQARGFVLLSVKESLSLSTLEAAACECPLLLADLPWATSYFGKGAMYCPISPATKTAAALKTFYGAAPGLLPPARPLSWLDVGKQLKAIYESLLAAPLRTDVSKLEGR
jgi:glycosyltransferase involved in cell wall biosynthesis